MDDDVGGKRSSCEAQKRRRAVHLYDWLQEWPKTGPESQALPVWKHQKEELIQGAKNAGSRSFHQDIML